MHAPHDGAAAPGGRHLGARIASNPILPARVGRPSKAQEVKDDLKDDIRQLDAKLDKVNDDIRQLSSKIDKVLLALLPDSRKRR